MKVRVKTTYLAHQPEFDKWLNQDFKYFILAKGRRLTWTRFTAIFITKKAISGKIKVLWVDTIHTNIIQYVAEFFMPLLKQLPSKAWSWNVQHKILKIFNSTIVFKSIDKPENMEGFGWDWIFINEAGICLKDPNLWEYTLLPMTLDPDYEALAKGKKGKNKSKVVVAGVPKGQISKGKEHVFYTLSKKTDDPEFTIINKSTHDNPYNTKEVIEKMMGLMDPLTYKQEILGLFVNKVGLLFLYCWEPHHKEVIPYNPKLEIYLSFDFNINPYTCGIIQEWTDKDGVLWINFIREIELTPDQANSGQTYTKSICDILKNHYPDHYYLITGDVSEKKGSVALKPNENAWTQIRKEFPDARIRLPSQNPRISPSQDQCNAMLSNEDRVKIRVNPKTCKGLVMDIESHKLNEHGEIDKTASAGAHHLDWFRYHLNTWHKSFIREG